MPGIAFHSLLNQTVQVSLAAMPAKARGVGQNARPSPLITLVAAPLNHPTCTHCFDHPSLLCALTHPFTDSLTDLLIHLSRPLQMRFHSRIIFTLKCDVAQSRSAAWPIKSLLTLHFKTAEQRLRTCPGDNVTVILLR